MERSFAHEIESLKLGDGDIFHGEGILAVLDAALRGEGALGGVPVAFKPLRREPANVH